MSIFNKYIGIKWANNGELPEGLDCYGLVKLILLEEFAIRLDDLFDYGNEDVGNIMMHEASKPCWLHVDFPVNSSVVLLGRGSMPSHMGIYIEDEGSSGIIHSTERTGAIFSSCTNIILSGWTNYGYYLHTGGAC